MNQKIIALLAGLLFGAVSGDWNPSLMFVMAAALMVTIPGFQYFLRRKPIFAQGFQLPSLKSIDRQLVIGAIIFGAGWGLVGLCPGPAIAALGYLNWEGVVFVLAMLAGAKLRQVQTT